MVAISTGAPSVLDRIVPDRLCCACIVMDITITEISNASFFIVVIFFVPIRFLQKSCQTSLLCVLDHLKQSSITNAAMASTTGTARTATHASCLPCLTPFPLGRGWG